MAPEPSSLEDLMELCIEGQSSALRSFYQTLLRSEFVVAERFQAQTLSDAPVYPNQFFNILAVQAKDYVVVPCFTQAAMLKEWSGNELTNRKMSFTQMLSVLPAEWWICINPGMQVEKELSSWELGLLRSGPESIDEIVDELSSDQELSSVEFASLEGQEYQNLKAALLELASNQTDITRIDLLLEQGQNRAEETIKRVLIGVWTEKQQLEIQHGLADQVKQLCAPTLIGAEPLRVLVIDQNKAGVMQQLFAGNQPFFLRSKKSAFLKRLFLRK